MYAVMETGGKQYRVSVGGNVRVEKLAGDVGEVIEISRVLLIAKDGDIEVGTPLIEGMSVKAEVVAHGRDKKIRVFKMKRRKKYRRTQGHRQAFTELRITDIGD
ncbi:MAG: 50S ribosomal protein L21 [Acidiferrobacteraceae bacterium]|nr:50S ribosomal protein L21 [Acidiferrobacteraceae bacterium]|tara:strand:+ start:1611 stop:1922 length:312 start_codon:yes stop_codon:yes gene_type:complete